VLAGWVALWRVVPTVILQTVLLALFGVAYLASAPRSADSERHVATHS
jgi:hypothetical protein